MKKPDLKDRVYFIYNWDQDMKERIEAMLLPKNKTDSSIHLIEYYFRQAFKAGIKKLLKHTLNIYRFN